LHDAPLFQVRRELVPPAWWSHCRPNGTPRRAVPPLPQAGPGHGRLGGDLLQACLPLEGKLLNVREANFKQVGENKINEIVKIIGLKYKKKYETDEDMRTLRHGKARPGQVSRNTRNKLIFYPFHVLPQTGPRGGGGGPRGGPPAALFLRAGADVMPAFTFYASKDKLTNHGNKAGTTIGVEKINREAATLAREVWHWIKFNYNGSPDDNIDHH
jgi:hypothetical protein